jgi:hypothetical protein
MEMDAKKIGLIVLAVVAVIAAVWSLKSSFFGAPGPAPVSDAERGKAMMQKMRQGGTGGPRR